MPRLAEGETFAPVGCHGGFDRCALGAGHAAHEVHPGKVLHKLSGFRVPEPHAIPDPGFVADVEPKRGLHLTGPFSADVAPGERGRGAIWAGGSGGDVPTAERGRIPRRGAANDVESEVCRRTGRER